MVLAACVAASGGCAHDQQAAQVDPNAGKIAPAPTPAPVTKVDLTAGPKAPPAPAPTYATSAGDAIVATITTTKSTRNITLGQLIDPLIETHGLNALLTLVQLELSKTMVEEQGQTITEADIARERDQTYAKLFQDFDEKADEQIATTEKSGDKVKTEKLRKDKEQGHQQLLDQFFTQQRITPGEFDILIRTNTYLRRVAEPLLKDKVTDEMVRKQYGVRYGETIKVKHIQLKRPTDAVEVRRRLAAGELFGKVAKDLSTNRQTAVLEGELPPFSREEPNLPPNFKTVAFALTKKGEVSDLVEADGTYHIIELEEKISPKVVKFEDVRQTIYDDLHEQYVQAVVKGLREKIGELARTNLKIQQPILQKQFAEKLAQRDAQLNAKKMAQDEWEKERRRVEAEQAVPATMPSSGRPATAPAGPTTRGTPDENLRALTQPATAPATPATPAATPK